MSTSIQCMLDPKEVDSSTSEGMNLLARVSTNRQKANLPSSMSFFIGIHQTVWTEFKVGLPISDNSINKNPSKVCLYAQVKFIAKTVKVTTKSNNHSLETQN